MLQYYKRVCVASQVRTQAVPGEGVDSATQGEVFVSVPRTAGLLCGAVLGEGCDAD